MSLHSGNVLVTGASGLVGAHVVAALRASGTGVARSSDAEAGAERDPAELAEFDLERPDPFARLCDGIDVVYHCAARLEGEADALFRINAHGTLRLLDGARRAGVRRFVHVSSCAVYRDGPLVRAPESHPRGGGSDYARAKQAAEDAVLAAGAAAELEVVVVRPCTVYGPGDRHFLPLIAELVRGCSFPEPIDGYAVHSVIHAADLARALVAAGSRPLPNPSCFNLAGEDVALGSVVETAARALGVELARFAWPWPEPLRHPALDPSGNNHDVPTEWARLGPSLPRPPIPWALVPGLTTERTLDVCAARAALGFAPMARFVDDIGAIWRHDGPAARATPDARLRVHRHGGRVWKS